MAQIRYLSGRSGDDLAKQIGRVIGRYDVATVSVQVLTRQVEDRRKDETVTVYEAFVVLPSS